MGLDGLLNFFKLPPDDEYEDEYDTDSRYREHEYEEPAHEEPVVRKKPIARPHPAAEEREEDTKKTGFLGSKPKVVSMNRGGSAMAVSIVKPTTFDDSQTICNILLSGQPVVVNLEGFDTTDAQRIMDFISGCIFSINGKYQQIAKFIFIFSPENIDISGDSLSYTTGSTKMPTLSREF
jgi:cell division inhibitor SepF